VPTPRAFFFRRFFHKPLNIAFSQQTEIQQMQKGSGRLLQALRLLLKSS
jgi:hypothetical protein